jgi:integrase
MGAKRTRRRGPGEGGAYPYKTATAGELWRVKGLVELQDGTKKELNKRGFETKKAALEWLADQQVAGRNRQYIEPTKRLLGEYGAEVIDGMRIAPSTKASYRKNWRLHIQAYPIAGRPLVQATGTALTSHYRALEKGGRKDHREGEGLSARTTRYVHTIVHAVLRQAVKDQLLLRNPADAATPPSAREARAPEMHCWNAAELATFLIWAQGNAQNYPLWNTLAMTGMRRGEALALRWRDVDLDAGTVSIRRSAGMVRNAGEGAGVVEGDTKTGKARVVDLDADATAVLRAHRKARGAVHLNHVRDDALIFGDLVGQHRNPEHVSRQFGRDVERCELVSAIRLHDLRHSHATILLTDRVPVHVVSQRLGHASATITMTTYAHVLPGSQREAADTFARLIREAGA